MEAFLFLLHEILTELLAKLGRSNARDTHLERCRSFSRLHHALVRKRYQALLRAIRPHMWPDKKVSVLLLVEDQLLWQPSIVFGGS